MTKLVSVTNGDSTTNDGKWKKPASIAAIELQLPEIDCSKYSSHYISVQPLCVTLTSTKSLDNVLHGLYEKSGSSISLQSSTNVIRQQGWTQWGLRILTASYRNQTNMEQYI